MCSSEGTDFSAEDVWIISEMQNPSLCLAQMHAGYSLPVTILHAYLALPSAKRFSKTAIVCCSNKAFCAEASPLAELFKDKVDQLSCLSQFSETSLSHGRQSFTLRVLVSAWVQLVGMQGIRIGVHGRAH